MKVEISEGERQLLILALAELALSRPGWDWTCSETVKKFGGDNAMTMFEKFKTYNSDRVPPHPATTDDITVRPEAGLDSARFGAEEGEIP